MGENAVATLAVTPKPAFDVPNGKAGVFGMQVGATTVSGKQLAQTAQPYTVQAQYTDAQLAAAGVQDPASLQLMAWDGAAWQPLQGGVDVQNKIVTGTTNLLQPLALVGAKPKAVGTAAAIMAAATMVGRMAQEALPAGDKPIV